MRVVFREWDQIPNSSGHRDSAGYGVRAQPGHTALEYRTNGDPGVATRLGSTTPTNSPPPLPLLLLLLSVCVCVRVAAGAADAEAERDRERGFPHTDTHTHHSASQPVRLGQIRALFAALHLGACAVAGAL